MKNIEVEFRSLVTEGKLRQLRDFLIAKAEDFGEDNKDTYFFILPNKLLKIVNNTSKNQAKVVLKLTALGEGNSFEEVETEISQKSIEDWLKIFKLLGFGKIVHAGQKRHNYLYKGVEISLKHSIDWGYHVELEIVVADKSETKEAEQKIQLVAKELELTLMTNEEVGAFVDKIIKAKATNY